MKSKPTDAPPRETPDDGPEAGDAPTRMSSPPLERRLARALPFALLSGSAVVSASVWLVAGPRAGIGLLVATLVAASLELGSRLR